MAQVQFLPEEKKIIGMAAHIWLKMLRAREKDVLNRIYGQFRKPEEVDAKYLPLIAEWAVIRDQISEIEKQKQQGE